MKERGYIIIKGRGISFADEKKVIVKGMCAFNLE
jgi:hypothetical protein